MSLRHAPRYKPAQYFLSMIMLLLTGIASSAEPDYTEEDHLQISLGGVYYSGLYQGQDGYLEPDLAFDMRYGRWFAEDLTFGYEIAKGERASLAIAITRGDQWLDTGDINDSQKQFYEGIENKDRAIEAGFVYKYRSRVGIVSFTFFKDYSDAYGGQRGSFRIERPIPGNTDFAITPSFFVTYYSESYNNYYFGVTREDNNRAIKSIYDVDTISDTLRAQYEQSRPEYAAGNSGHIGFALDMRWRLSGDLALAGHISYEELTGPVYRSPLVEDKEIIIAKLGLAYTF